MKRFNTLLKGLIGVICFIPLLGFSQVFHSGERITLDSKVLEESREIQVLLPEGYSAEPESSYPVIYLLDGDYNFHGISGMLDLLANKGQLIPKVILVSIGDKGTETYRQYMTPNDSASPLKKKNGAATEFLAFLNQEVQPYIKQHYRAADHGILMGHSIGGLFVLNSVLNAPDSFRSYVAVSPSVWVSDNAIVAQAKEKLKKIDLNGKSISLYLSLADEMQMGQYDFINELDLFPSKSINWSFTHYPSENHNSVGLIALRDSLKQIFKGWYLPEKILERNNPEETLAHYQAMLKKSGFSQSIPASVVHIMIRQHYRQKKADQLPAFITAAMENFPASRQVLLIKQASFVGYYDSQEAALALLLKHESEFSQSRDYYKALAGTYEQLKQADKAKTSYQKALKLAEMQNANLWELNILRAKLHK